MQTLILGDVIRRVRAISLLVGCALIASCGGDGDNTSAVAPPVNNPPVSNLPPDPGETGLQTITGIDSDLDGVRDDLQIYIFNRFSGLDRDAMMQVAISLQDQLLANQTTALATASATRVFRSIGCYLSIQSGVPAEQKSIEIRLLQAKVVNTIDRLQAHKVFSRAIGEQTFTALPLDQQLDSCEFNVN